MINKKVHALHGDSCASMELGLVTYVCIVEVEAGRDVFMNGGYEYLVHTLHIMYNLKDGRDHRGRRLAPIMTARNKVNTLCAAHDSFSVNPLIEQLPSRYLQERPVTGKQTNISLFLSMIRSTF